MNDTNVGFSDKELNVISNRDFFYVKDTVTDKIYRIFEDLRSAVKKTPEFQSFSFPGGTDTTSGKIARGESYQLLPYVVMDFPKLFNRQSIFAFRSMFWWGHFFSFTLHLQHQVLQDYRPVLKEYCEQLYGKRFYISINDTPWNHTFQPENMKPVDYLSVEELRAIIDDKHFFKISRKLSLQEWDKISPYGKQTYRHILNFLAA